MAIKAKLFVDGEYYNIKEFSYGFTNGSNTNGFSSSKTRQIGLTCVIEAIRQEYFEEWAMESNFKKYIEVHISEGVNSMGRTRVLKCHDTFLLELHTRFSSSSSEPMSFELFMKSGAIEFSWSTAAHVEAWSELPTQEGEVTVIEETLEPRIIDYFISDLNGTRVSDIEVGDKILINLQTENMVGKTYSINLDNPEVDFKHKGKILINDTLKDYPIGNEIETIELEVVEELETIMSTDL